MLIGGMAPTAHLRLVAEFLTLGATVGRRADPAAAHGGRTRSAVSTRTESTGNMTERSRRSFLRSALLGTAAAGGAVLLPAGPARATGSSSHQHCGCPAPTPSVPQYQFQVTNDSSQYQDFCIYQASADLGVPDAVPLAWKIASVPPASAVTVTWSEQYDFVWGLGSLAPGETFNTEQVLPADPNNPALQAVQLTSATGAYTFERLPASPNFHAGNLYIQQSGDVPLREASVGIGMSGASAYVAPTEPDRTLVFTPQPEYWVAGGSFVQGQVLDIEQMTSQAPLEFPSGVFSLTATLSESGWSIT